MSWNVAGLKLVDANGVNICHFFRGTSSGLCLDHELLDLMQSLGWAELAIAFESASPRILERYASKKWSPDRHDVVGLVRATAARGIRTMGFFTIGYPDETYEELLATAQLAQRLVDQSLDAASFYIMNPYPGTELYDIAVAGGHLPPDLELMNMKFQLPTMINTVVPPEVIRWTRRLAYTLIHPEEHVAHKDSRTLACQSASLPSGKPLQD
jgi:anaerobic magnesium-protoporphyrin IX monomethyl ester cyclase